MRSAKPVIVPREESINAQKQSIQYRLVAHVCTPATASRAPTMRSTYAHTMFALIRVTLQGILATQLLDVPMRARTERLPGVLVVQEATGTQWQSEGTCLHNGAVCSCCSCCCCCCCCWASLADLLVKQPSSQCVV